jgi:two-component system nitrogen regulation response regulator GlnG
MIGRNQAERRRGDITRALIVAESEPMRGVVDAILAAADQDAPALIEGERGTGRELVARVLHYSGRRCKGPFVAIEAGAAPQPLFRDALDRKRGGPLQAAAGGTFLVKDLCALSRGSQQRLSRILRALATGRAAAAPDRAEVTDVRVVGAADHDLPAAVTANVFHRELYDQMVVNRIALPPLRDRTADIPPLATQFVRKYAREIGRGRMTMSTRAFDRLVKYPWPGNVAELKEITRRLVLRAGGSRIEAGDVDGVLPVIAQRIPLEDMSFEEMVRVKLGAFLRRVDGYPVTDFYADVIARVEAPLLGLVMEHTGGNQVRAAEILGVNRNTLRRKLGELKLRGRIAREAGPEEGA